MREQSRFSLNSLRVPSPINICIMKRAIWAGLGIFISLIFSGMELKAQDQEAPSKWEISGYVKYLHSTTFTALPAALLGTPLSSTFFHNRLNVHYYPNSKWTIAVESRNRLFYGDGQQIKLDTNFVNQIDQYPGVLDLSVRWVDNKYALLHSVIDRAYLRYSHEKWEITVGRQRINWGINTIWNPNDLFNALNFLDFDYEERPGSDAIRIQYFPGLLSRVELAVAPGRYDSTTVAAALYRFNAKGYDIQLLTGYYLGDYTVGGGWEGNLGGAGFKGEMSYFTPIEGLSSDTADAVGATVALDYMLGNGLYVSGGALYNSRGDLSGGSTFGNNLAGGSLSAKNLFPAPWAFVASASGSFTPLWSGNFSVIYAPQSHLTGFLPTTTISIKENWDIDLIGQLFFIEAGDAFQHVSSSAFIRLKWSY